MLCGGFEKSRFEKKSKSLLSKNLILLALLGQENSLDVRQNTSLSNGDSTQKLVQLLVVPDGQLKMPGVDPQLLVVTGGVASQLKDLSSQVLDNCSQVDWGTSSNALTIVAPLQVTVNTAHWELKSSTGRTGLALGTGFASLSTSRHDDE